MTPREHPCAICGEPVAPFGYRKRGSFSEQKRKGYLWVCAKHRPEAEQRKGDE